MNFKDSTRKIKEDADEFAWKIMEGAEKLADESETADAVRDLAFAVKEDLMRIKEKMNKKKENAKNYILENPVKATAIAVAAGVLVGFIFGLRMGRKKWEWA